MKLSLLSLSVSLSVSVPVSVSSVQWTPLSCPSGSLSGSCSYQNPSDTTDQAVSLFFQIEMQAGEQQAGFECTDADTGLVLCAREWTADESGSAGDCFFIVGAGREMKCEPTHSPGNINFIGAHATDLTVNAIPKGAKAEAITCPSSSGKCSHQNTAKTDQWIGVSMTGSAPASGSNSDGRSGLSCTVDSVPVCSWGVNASATENAQSGSSCGFLLAAEATLECDVVGTAPKVNKAHAITLSDTFAPAKGAKPVVTSKCPIHNPKNAPTMCDCTWTNDGTEDVVVVTAVQSADENFNSFHCFVDGANVCAWGSNQDNQADNGGCWFVLPVGSSYGCAMEWGATSVTHSSVTPMTKSLFGSSRTHLAPKRVDGVDRRVAAAAQEAKRSASLVDIKVVATEVEMLFQRWKKHHSVQYGTEEEARQRLLNFDAFVRRFHWSNGRLEEAMPNSLAALTVDEFETSYRDCAQPSLENDAWLSSIARSADLNLLTEDEVRAAPTSANWTAKGAVTPVKDQGQCGSCWSFSTTGALEGHWQIAGNSLEALSEQTLVSCDRDDDNLGCGGGFPYEAMEWVRKNGIDTEESYPYASGDGSYEKPPWGPPCEYPHKGTRASVNVTGHVLVQAPSNSTLKGEDYLAAFVAKYGPVAINVDAMTQIWWPYAGGVMTGCCNKDTDHAVLIVGYGHDEETSLDYWLIKNSWNAGWGENGYVRLKRGDDQCGILTQPVVPTVTGGVIPPPPPPPPPTPAWECPADSKNANTSAAGACVWTNGTTPKGGKASWLMPPVVDPYCEYISSGYFGYTYEKKDYSPEDYPCPPSAALGTNSQTNTSGEWFCTVTSGSKGLTFPAHIKANCDNMESQGVFGYTWPK